MIIPAIGFGALGLLLAGLMKAAAKGVLLLKGLRLKRIWESPWMVFVIPGSVHYLMVAGIDIRSVRQMLVLLPAVCLLAAFGAVAFTRWVRRRRRAPTGWAAGLLLAALMMYQAGYAWGVGGLFAGDPRLAASRWLGEQVNAGQEVTAYMHYSRVPGSYRMVRHPSDYILTVSNEFSRYLGKTDPSQIFHCVGGMPRLRFWNQLFNGELDYRLVKKFRRTTAVPELRLARKRGWSGLGTFIPSSVVIFKRQEGPERGETGYGT